MPEHPRRQSVIAVESALAAAESALASSAAANLQQELEGFGTPTMDESDKAIVALVLKWVHHRHSAVTEAQLLATEESERRLELEEHLRVAMQDRAALESKTLMDAVESRKNHEQLQRVTAEREQLALALIEVELVAVEAQQQASAVGVKLAEVTKTAEISERRAVSMSLMESLGAEEAQLVQRQKDTGRELASALALAELEAELAESKAVEPSSASELHASVGRIAELEAELAESKAVEASSASELHASVGRIAELEAELAESKAVEASSASELHASVGRIAELEAELASNTSEAVIDGKDQKAAKVTKLGAKLVGAEAGATEKEAPFQIAQAELAALKESSPGEAQGKLAAVEEEMTAEILPSAADEQAVVGMVAAERQAAVEKEHAAVEKVAVEQPAAVEAAITKSTKAEGEKDWARKIGKAAAEKAAADRAAAATERAAKDKAAAAAEAEQATKEAAEKAAADKAAKDKAVADKAAADKAAADKAAADKAAKAKAAKDVGKKAAQLMACMSVLDFSLKCRMNPLQLRKAGAIVTNMQAAGFGEDHINTVCRALFLDQDDVDQMKQAWFVFAGGMSVLKAREFKKSLLLMGEEVPEDEVDEMFKKADTDGSGEIDFDEFVELIREMNAYDDNTTHKKVPTTDGERSDGVFGFSPW